MQNAVEDAAGNVTFNAAAEAGRRIQEIQRLLPPTKHLKKGEILQAIVAAVLETDHSVAVRMMMAIAKKIKESDRNTEADLTFLFGERAADVLLGLLEQPRACICQKHEELADKVLQAARKAA